MSAPVPDNPFPGLRPFREDEAHLFFGRESQVDAMVDRLAATRFLVVLGTSGSGKSSLVRCGLLPALHRGWMARAGTRWRVADLRPGSDPVRALAEALSFDNVLFDPDPVLGELRRAVIEASLRLSRLGLVDVVSQARLPPGTNLLVLVDQFEELFRYETIDGPASGTARLQAAIAFVTLLLAVRDRVDGRIEVVLTMRSDFLGDCTRVPGLAEAINDGQYLVPRMTRDERRACISGPIEIAGARIDSALTTRLVNDLGDDPDQLSILQHALNRTFAAWKADAADNAPITLAHYEAIGTMSDALDRHAESTYAGLMNDRQRLIAERLFKALTDCANDSRGIRRPSRLATLVELTEVTRDEVIAVIDAFRAPDRSFLMPALSVPLRDETVIDLAHESLMRVWRRLVSWAADEAASAQQLRRLADSATLCASGQVGLWRDPELQLALDWRERQRPTDAWASRYGHSFEAVKRFLRDSESEREAGRLAARRARARRRNGLVATMVALVLIGVAFFALWRKSDAARRDVIAAKTVGQGRLMLSTETVYAVDAALLVIAAGYRLHPTADVYDALQFALERTARLTRTVPLPQPAITIAPTFDRVVTVDDRGTMRIRNAMTGEALSPPMTGHAQRVSAAAFTPDGKTLVSASEDGTLRRWDAATGQSIGAALAGNDGPIWSVAVSPDGQLIASGGEDGALRLWSLVSGDSLKTLSGHARRLWAVAFSPDGSTVATGSDDKSVRLWSVAHALSLWRRDFAGVISSVAFSDDGTRLAVGGGDAMVHVLDARTGAGLADLEGHGSRIWTIAFGPRGRQIASGSEDRSIRLWQNERSSALVGHKGRVWRVAFGREGMTILSASADRTIDHWDLRGATREPLFKHDKAVRTVAVSLDGSLLASGGDDGSLRLWDVAARAPTRVPPMANEGEIAAVAFSPDGRRIASGSPGGALHVWAIDGTSLGTTTAARGVWSVAFGKDGQTIVTGGDDGAVSLWQSSGKLARSSSWPAHLGRVWSVAVSPDGKTIASGGEDGMVRTWDASTGRPLHEFVGHFKRVWSVAFVSNEMLASGGEDASVRRWDPRSGEAIGAPLVGHLEPVTSLAISADGSTLASGSDDATIRFWDATTGEPRGEPIRGHSEALSALAFAPDGRTLFSASEDASIRAWDAPAGWIDRVCAKVVRNLTHDEWKRLVGDLPYVTQCPGLPLPSG